MRDRKVGDNPSGYRWPQAKLEIPREALVSQIAEDRRSMFLRHVYVPSLIAIRFVAYPAQQLLDPCGARISELANNW